MQSNHDISNEVCEQFPQWLLEFRHVVLQSIRVKAIVGLERGILYEKLVIRSIVESAMAELLFDKLIWVSFKSKRDFSMKNVYLAIMMNLHLPVMETGIDNEQEKDWNARARRINDLLINKKLLFVVEDPPAEGINLLEVGVPAFSSWTSSRLIIISQERDVFRSMQAGVVHSVPTENKIERYDDLIRLECFDIACSPRFRFFFTGETVLSCFKCLSLFGGSVNTFLETTAPLYWVGEGLLEGASNRNGQSYDLTNKLRIGEELLNEFRQRSIFGIDGKTNVSYYIPSYRETSKWVSFSEEYELLRVGEDYLETSIFSIRNPSVREIPVDLFKTFKCLHVLDLSNTSISTLPASLTNVTKSLRVLLLKQCKQIHELPSDIQYLECLEILNLEGCSLKSDSCFTFSFEHLQKLQYLNFSSNHNLSFLTQSICSLCNLEQLNLQFCTSLTELPELSLQFMNKLVLLDLSFASALHSLPSSISSCINLKNLLLKSCTSLKVGVSHLLQHPNLEKLDLSGCVSLQEISAFKPQMPNLQYLNLSGVNGIEQLSLRLCPSLNEVGLVGCSNLEELDLSGTNIKRFPHEVCTKGASLKRLYMLGKLDLLEVNWEGMNQLPRELFYVDECCESLNSPPSSVESLRNLKGEAFISVGSNTTFFNGYSPQGFLQNYQRLNIFISPCEERGIKGTYLHFRSKHLKYKDIYQKSLSPTSSSLAIKLGPNTHFAHAQERRQDAGGCLEVNGEIKFKGSIAEVFYEIQIFSVFNNKSIANLSEFGFRNMETMRECWIRRCHGMESIFVEDSEPRESKVMIMPSLEIIWISNLSRLKSVFNFRNYERTHFGSLKHMNLEYCPKLVNVSTFTDQWKISFRSLETLEIRFCVRMERVFVDDGGPLKDKVSCFPRLHSLCLWELSSLKSIAGSNVYFPSLEKLTIRGCPKLDTLPICFDKDGHNRTAKIEIKGELGWWKNLKWGVDSKIIKNCMNFIGWKPPNKKWSAGARTRKVGSLRLR